MTSYEFDAIVNILEGLYSSISTIARLKSINQSVNQSVSHYCIVCISSGETSHDVVEGDKVEL